MTKETDSYDLTPSEAQTLIAEQRQQIGRLKEIIGYLLESFDRHAVAARGYAGMGFTAEDEAKR